MGGKRKSKAKGPPKKKRATVPRTFKCPFCSNDGACEVKLNRAAETGDIACRVCGEAFRCRVTYLSDPVDVFCEWVDELEKSRVTSGGGGAATAGVAARARLRGDDDEAGGGLGAARRARETAGDDFLDEEV